MMKLLRSLTVLALAAAVSACNPWAGPTPRAPLPPVVKPEPSEPTPVEPSQPTPPAPSGRTGAVRLEGRAFVDDQGAFNAFGASLFWALWGEKHDAARLEQNIAFLAQFDVDYIRILGMVGNDGWSDRRIDPTADDYWPTVDALFARLARHGLRAQVTIFADAQAVMPSAEARRAFASEWATYADMHADRVQLLEVANEYWQNGLDVAEVRAIGRYLDENTEIPIALSAFEEGHFCSLYGGAVADVASIHYDRNVSLADGPWRPERQPWGFPIEYAMGCRFDGPALNNEPIGPHASVAEDADPLRLALGYVTTFVAGNAAYVYHTGAGIRGGGWADQARGRFANVFDYDHTIIRALQHWRNALPAGLANWTRANAQWAEFPWDGSQHAVDRGDIVRAYVTMSGEQLRGVILGVRRPHAITAKRPLELQLLHPVTGDTLHTVSLQAGQAWTIPADLTGYVVVGRLR